MARSARAWLHLLWGVPGAVVLLSLLAAISPFALLRSRGVRDWALDRARVASIFSGESRVRVDRVVRLDPGRAHLAGVRVERRTEAGWVPWLRIGRIEANLRPDDFFGRRIYISSLLVDSVAVDLTRAPDPLFAPAKGDGRKRAQGPLRLPPIRCASLAVRGAQVETSGGHRWGGELELSGLAHRDGQVRGTLRRAAVQTLPDTLRLALEDGLLEAVLVESAALEAAKVAAPGLRGRIDASWLAADASEDSAGHVAMQIQIAAFAPARTGLLRPQRLPIEEADSVAGRVVGRLTLRPGSPITANLGIDLAGSLFGTPLDTLLVAVAASPDEVRITGLRLRFGGVALGGEARVARPGRAEAALTLSKVDLSSPPISRFAPRLPESEISGVVRAEADSIGPRIRLQAALGLEPGMLMGRPVRGLSARGSLDPRTIAIEELQTSGLPDSAGGAIEPELRFRGALERTTERLRGEGTLHRLPLEDWVAPWLRNVVLEGEVSGPVRVGGTLRRPRVDGDLVVAGGRAMDVRIDSLHASSIRGSLSPLRLSTELRATGIDAYKVALDSLRGPVEVADTIRARFRARRDTTSLALDLRVVPVDRGAVFFDSLRIRAGSAPPLVLDGPSRLDWAPDLVRVDSIRFRSEAGTVRGSGWIAPRPGRSGEEPFAFEASGEAVDLSAVAGYLGLPAAQLGGALGLDFSGEGTVRAPRYRARIAAEGIRTYDWYWERIDGVAAAGEGIGLRIDSLRVTGSGYHGPLPGIEQVGPALPGPPLLIRADSLSASFPASWEELLAALADSARAGRMIGSARIGGRIEARGVPVAPLLAPLLHARHITGTTNVLAQTADPMLAKIQVVHPVQSEEERRRPSGIGGTIDLAANLGGTGRDLACELDLVGRGVWVYQAWADSVRLRAAARDSLVRIDGARWQMGPTELSARGELALRLAANPPAMSHTARRGWLEADLKQADLALVSLLTGVIQDPVGSLDGHLRLETVARHPKLGGQVSVRDAAFRVAGREERFSRVEGEGRIDSLGMHLEAKGRLNEEGRVRVSGIVRDLDDFDLKARVDKAPIFETANYRFLVDADLAAAPVAEGDTLRPRLTGKVNVLEGLITQDLAKPPARQPPKTPWLVDLQVAAPGNLRLNQPFAVVDLGEGDLAVIFRWPYWNLDGSLEVLDGSYRVFNRTFRITSGTVTFEDSGKGPDPKLEIEAETDIPVQEAAANAGEGEDPPPIHVVLQVSGHPARKELEVSLSGSDGTNDYAEAELIERMSLGQIQTGEFGTFSSADPTRQAISSELIGQIERQLVAQLPWADRVQLQGQIGGANPLWVNFRPIVQPQWSVVYAQQLSATPDREVSLRYRLSNLLYLNAAVDRRQKEEGIQRDTYSLDLKVRFDY